MASERWSSSIFWPILGILLIVVALLLAFADLGNWWILIGATGAGVLGAGLVTYLRGRRQKG